MHVDYSGALSCSFFFFLCYLLAEVDDHHGQSNHSDCHAKQWPRTCPVQVSQVLKPEQPFFYPVFNHELKDTIFLVMHDMSKIFQPLFLYHLHDLCPDIHTFRNFYIGDPSSPWDMQHKSIHPISKASSFLHNACVRVHPSIPYRSIRKM